MCIGICTDRCKEVCEDVYEDVCEHVCEDVCKDIGMCKEFFVQTHPNWLPPFARKEN